MAGVQKTYALILGLVLLIIGVWGFFLPGGKGDILNLFGVNYLQSGLHIIAALFGIYAGTKGAGRGYNAIIGWIGIVLGVLGFVPGINTLFASLLNINTNITVLHLVIGLVSLGVYYGASK